MTDPIAISARNLIKQFKTRHGPVTAVNGVNLQVHQGETFGPFGLPDANRIYTFPVQFTARTLRFDTVEASGGNTGAVESEVYGTPHE